MENKVTVSKEAKHGLVIISTAAFLVPFMGSSLNLALPKISHSFSVDAVMLTWLSTAYLISTAIFQVPFARVSDLVGRKKIFLSGVALFTVCTILCGFAPSIGVLLAMRFLSGIGSAMMMGTNIAILTSLFPPAERGRALGINSAVVYAAIATGPVLGGLLTDYFDWHSIFFAGGAVGVVVLALSRFFLKGEWVEARGEKFDFAGSLLYGVGLALLIYGFSSLTTRIGITCICGGIVAFFFFGRYELRHRYPVFNLRLFSGNRVFALSSLASLINYAATSGLGFMLSLYLQFVRGFDARHAGIILISQACIQSLFSLLSGPLSSRFPPSRIATFGMALTTAGLTGMVFVGHHTPLWIIVGLLMTLGVGFGIFAAPNTNVIMSSVGVKDYSQASATTGTVRLTGQAFSMGIAAMAISMFVGSRQLTAALAPEFMESMRLTLIIFAALCALGVFASSARVREITRK